MEGEEEEEGGKEGEVDVMEGGDEGEKEEAVVAPAEAAATAAEVVEAETAAAAAATAAAAAAVAEALAVPMSIKAGEGQIEEGGEAPLPTPCTSPKGPLSPTLSSSPSQNDLLCVFLTCKRVCTRPQASGPSGQKIAV